MSKEVLVTDTHPLLNYFCGRQKKLSKKVKRTFDDSLHEQRTVIYVPSIVLWEMLLLVENGDVQLSMTFDEWVERLFAYPMFMSLPFDNDVVLKCRELVFIKDPFDKAIVASALHIDVPLISNDMELHKYKPCQLFWD
jgi:PIN domain nuclease of toxin-antitoxin system